ncbi:MAG: SemiSWEET family sugar transporter [Candidatus Limnocylindria bacterium]
MTDALGVLAASWGVLMALSPLLQIRRMLHRRSSADVSITYLSVLQVGFMLWLLYGWALGNPAIMVPNAVALVIGAAAVVIAVRYRHPERSSRRT